MSQKSCSATGPVSKHSNKQAKKSKRDTVPGDCVSLFLSVLFISACSFDASLIHFVLRCSKVRCFFILLRSFTACSFDAISFGSSSFRAVSFGSRSFALRLSYFVSEPFGVTARRTLSESPVLQHHCFRCHASTMPLCKIMSTLRCEIRLCLFRAFDSPHGYARPSPGQAPISL